MISRLLPRQTMYAKSENFNGLISLSSSDQFLTLPILNRKSSSPFIFFTMNEELSIAHHPKFADAPFLRRISFSFYSISHSGFVLCAFFSQVQPQCHRCRRR